MKILVLGSLLCLNLLPALGQQTEVRSLGLWEARRFDEPARRYIQAAEDGSSRGLARVAQTYLSGDGLTQDYMQLAVQISAAAERGDQWAQLMLGLIYFAGRGVQEDRVRAHMWSNVAASGADEKIAALARVQRDMVSHGLSTGQTLRAQALAREWKPRDAAKSDAEKRSTPLAFWRR